MVRARVRHVPLLRTLAVAIVGQPQHQEGVVEGDGHDDRQLERPDPGGQADPDRAENEEGVARALQRVAEADGRGDAGYREGQRERVLDDDDDAGDHDRHDDDRVDQRLVVILRIADRDVDPAHRKGGQQRPGYGDRQPEQALA